MLKHLSLGFWITRLLVVVILILIAFAFSRIWCWPFSYSFWMTVPSGILGSLLASHDDLTKAYRKWRAEL